MSAAALQELELDLFVEGVKRRYGYEFGGYARASLARRVAHRQQATGDPTISALLARVLHDEEVFDELLADLSVTVTSMFRDPSIYRSVRAKIVPDLAHRDFVKVWHAGCATGEELYSVAVLLYEAGCLDRARLYGTDFNPRSLDKASEGIFPADRMAGYTHNYYQSGGQASFTDYFRAQYGSARMSGFLRDRAVFAHHNLVLDGGFEDVDLVVCRNVLIYFDRELQDTVLTTLTSSLRTGGYLWLGNAESLEYAVVRDQFECVLRRERVYRKLGP